MNWEVLEACVIATIKAMQDFEAYARPLEPFVVAYSKPYQSYPDEGFDVHVGLYVEPISCKAVSVSVVHCGDNTLFSAQYLPDDWQRMDAEERREALESDTEFISAYFAP